jgi:hypothetical protein
MRYNINTLSVMHQLINTYRESVRLNLVAYPVRSSGLEEMK